MDPPISNCTIEAELGIKPKKDKKNRVPRRVIHFSDGVIEEFSTDSEEEEEKRKMEEADKGTSKQFLYIYRALKFRRPVPLQQYIISTHFYRKEEKCSN